MEPITEIPAHIRALPEAEQGPALVKAIHDRKTAEQLRVEFNAEMHEALQEQFQLGLRAGTHALWSAVTSSAANLPADSHLLPGLHMAMLMLEDIKKEVLDGAGPR